MENTSVYMVKEESDNQRLDLFLSEQLNVSRSQAQKYYKENRVLVNGVPPKKAGMTLKTGMHVEIIEATPKVKAMLDMKDDLYNDIEILSETPDYVVVVKPSGLLVHPTQAEEPVSLAAWLVKKYPEITSVGESPLRPGIVHRLDREASGILVVARTQSMYEHLKKQFQNRTIIKEYSVLVHGSIEIDHAVIDFLIDRGSDGRMVSRPHIKDISLKNVTAIQTGKEAITEFWVKQRYAGYTLLTVKIHTGRTHQIRVHMYAYNHPVLGDALYTQQKLNHKRDRTLGRLFLHATKLCFVDHAGEERCFTAPLPKKLDDCLNELHAV